MPSYVFPGYPVYLHLASTELGHPESAGPASRIAPLTSLANLCAQAAHGNPANLKGILIKAAEFRHQLATALRAADFMLADVEAAGLTTSVTHSNLNAELSIETSAAQLRPSRKST